METADVYLKPPSAFLNGSGPDAEFIVASQSAQTLAFQSGNNIWAGNISFEENGVGSYIPSHYIVNMMYGRGISSLQNMMSNLAKSMTKNMHTSPTAHPATGTASQDVPFMLVRLQWIAPPCALQIFTLVFLVGTMVDSARRGVMLWKSSSSVDS